MTTITPPDRVRPAPVADRFYSGSATALRDSVRRFMEGALPLADVRAVVAPHAGYPCIGMIAPATFGTL